MQKNVVRQEKTRAGDKSAEILAKVQAMDCTLTAPSSGTQWPHLKNAMT